MTEKIVLRLECFEPSCRSQRMLAIERGKRFELGRDENDRVKWSSFQLRILFPPKDNKILRLCFL